MPEGWDFITGDPIPTNGKAQDPGNAERWLLVSGDPVEDPTVAAKVRKLRATSGAKPGYDEVKLEPVGGTGMVDWEFRLPKEGGLIHCYGRYWRENGVDYAVFARSPEADWPATFQHLLVMMTTVRVG